MTRRDERASERGRRRQLEVGELFGTLLCRRDSQRLLVVVVEVARVAGTLALGNERRVHLSKSTASRYARESISRT